MVIPAALAPWRAFVTASRIWGPTMASIYFIRSPSRLLRPARVEGGDQGRLHPRTLFRVQLPALGPVHVEDVEGVALLGCDLRERNVETVRAEHAGDAKGEAGLVLPAHLDHR